MANSGGNKEEGQARLSGLDDEPAVASRGSASFDVGESSRGDAPDFILNRRISLMPPNDMDRAVFCRNLSTMIEVGIPLLRALKMLGKRTDHAKLAQAISNVADGVEEGQSVAEVMKKHERIFSPLVVSIIKVGEVGGILEASLARLADIMESKANIRRKVRAATMYPSVVLSVAFIVIVIILIKAVPVFTEAYGSAGKELPVPTQVVIALSGFVISYFWLWIPALVAAILGYLYFITTPPGREFTSNLGLRTPYVGGITRKIAVARFSRTLSSLLNAGIPLTESLGITADTNENTIVRRALFRVQDNVEQGRKMSPQIASARIFPNLVVDMISIGEETGTLDRMLDKIADIYDADVDASLDGIQAIIEPLLIVVLGLVVVFIALAVMMPYFNMVDVI